ncbi:MAG TPA: zinc ribbon domain-containing protein [Thermoanaerobaculia bacterium]|jgi:Zn-finger nucleic acid-binding protein|nr:zinc ribbon domain-containing protein [Thermoanaerobaculia bacterium]
MSMRHLIVCSRCRRQLDAGDRAAGELVPCPCGEMVAVPPLAAHDSAVVRCSACGAPREGDEPECRYCGASFTVRERDIDTICPVCMARVSGGARFCDHCGSPILVDQAAAAATTLRCPACGPRQLLRSRQFAGEPVAVSECVICGGLWTERRVFEVLLVRARHGELGGAAVAIAGGRPERPAGTAAAGAGGVGAGTEGAGAGAGAAGGGHLYRPCPVCGALMNRQNYGRKSGVILDLCGVHGIWFDLDELPRVLAWIQGGGEERAGQLEAEEARATAREQRLEKEFSSSVGGGSWGYAEPNRNLLGGLVNLLGDGWSNLFDR